MPANDEPNRTPEDSAALRKRIGPIADRFEAALKAALEGQGPTPQIDAFVAEAAEPDRDALREELTAVEAEYRRMECADLSPLSDLSDASSSKAATSRRTPKRADESARDEDGLPVTRLRRVRCPHCHSPINLVDKQSDEVLCPSCGSSFRLRDTRLTSTVDQMRQIGKFQLLERLGLGAFGAVWKARDTVLDKVVALKIPHAGLLESAADRERFLREARAAANLRHPAIVSVHEVAELETESGKLPAIVSDFLEGVTLRELLENRRLTFRESAELVAQLAEALDYAHATGIVHRDIKPGNIMIEYPAGLGLSAPLDEESTVKGSGVRSQGPDGAQGSATSEHSPLTTQHSPRLVRPRPLILDFGLALREAEAAATMTLDGQVLGTPAYMSPEQASGHGHRVDGRSDVWSLGVILYELLTGELPFRGSRHALLLQIRHDEPRRPRRVNEKIPRDLETITLKCLAKEPSRRYATARALSDDLRRWLGGEPILARPVGALEKLWLWSRRNPRVAVLSAAVVLLLVGLAAASSIVAVQQHQHAKTERELRQKAHDATALAQKNARQAEDNAAVARAQSQLALKSLERVILDIQRKLENVPGAGDLRRSLLQTALADLRKVSDQFASRSAIDRNTCVALIDLGGVFLRIGSDANSPSSRLRGEGRGEGQSDADGLLSAARKVYQQAFEIAQKLAAADPSDARAQRDLSVSYEKLGDVQRQSGQVTDALGSYQKGLAIRQKLAAADPSDARAQRDLSVSYEKLGEVQRQSGQVTEALGSYQKGLAIRQKLAAADPSDAQAQRDLSVSYERLGDVQLKSGQVTEALGSYQQCLEIRQKLAAADPSDAQAQRDLSVSYERLGDVQRQSGQVTEALGSYQKDLEISQKLAAADPSDAQAQRDLSISYSKLGDVQLQSGQVTEALGWNQKALEISQKLAAADPSDARAQRDLFISYSKLGDVQRQSGQVTEALGSYQKGLAISQKLAAADPSDAQAQLDLVASHHKIATVQQRQKQYEQAIESYGRALKVLQTLKDQKRLAPANEKWIGIVQQAIEQCKQSATALGDWKTLVEQPLELLPVLLEMRGIEFVQEGRTAEAVQAVAKLLELKTATAGQLYNAACVYSLCAAAIKPDEGKRELAAEQSAARQQHMADALATLREAIKAGWSDFAHMQQDPDLTVLRDLPEFQALLPGGKSDGKR